MADGPARKLVLLRHAKSAWPDVPDYERPLARRGQRDAPVTGLAVPAPRPTDGIRGAAVAPSSGLP